MAAALDPRHGERVRALVGDLEAQLVGLEAHEHLRAPAAVL